MNIDLWQIGIIFSVTVLLIVSGLSRSLVHTLLHHYDQFKKKWDIENDRFWNPAISWKGKYITDDNFDLILDINHKPQRKPGVMIPLFDAFHRFNTIELISDHIRESLYFSILFYYLYGFIFGNSFLIFIAALIFHGGIKILISFNIGYDKLWR